MKRESELVNEQVYPILHAVVVFLILKEQKSMLMLIANRGGAEVGQHTALFINVNLMLS